MPTEGHTMPTEGHTMTPESHTKATQRCEFFKVVYPQDTRKLHDVVLTVGCVQTRYEGVTRPPDGIKCWADHEKFNC